MNPGEALTAIFTMGILFVAFPAILLHGIARVKRAKAQAAGKGGDALRMSELRGMIDEAVDRATRPLLARIETLEEIATAHNDDVQLLSAPKAPRLTLDEGEGELEAAPSARARARV